MSPQKNLSLGILINAVDGNFYFHKSLGYISMVGHLIFMQPKK